MQRYRNCVSPFPPRKSFDFLCVTMYLISVSQLNFDANIIIDRVRACAGRETFMIDIIDAAGSCSPVGIF